MLPSKAAFDGDELLPPVGFMVYGSGLSVAGPAIIGFMGMRGEGSEDLGDSGFCLQRSMQTSALLMNSGFKIQVQCSVSRGGGAVQGGGGVACGVRWRQETPTRRPTHRARPPAPTAISLLLLLCYSRA